MSNKLSNKSAAIRYMNNVKNPLCTVPEISRMLTGRSMDSNDSDYKKTYRMLEKMTDEKLLYKVSVKNGGCVYISRARVLSPVINPVINQDTDDELPF